MKNIYRYFDSEKFYYRIDVYLEDKFGFYETTVQLDLSLSRVDSMLSLTLQCLLLHYLPALFNYCSMRELVFYSLFIK